MSQLYGSRVSAGLRRGFIRARSILPLCPSGRLGARALDCCPHNVDIGSGRRTARRNGSRAGDPVTSSSTTTPDSAAPATSPAVGSHAHQR